MEYVKDDKTVVAPDSYVTGQEVIRAGWSVRTKAAVDTRSLSWPSELFLQEHPAFRQNMLGSGGASMYF
jgi:hypothetical protein